MAKVPPFHSTQPNDRNVHHNNDDCTEGNNIEPENVAQGDGGYPLCEHCASLA